MRCSISPQLKYGTEQELDSRLRVFQKQVGAQFIGNHSKGAQYFAILGQRWHKRPDRAPTLSTEARIVVGGALTKLNLSSGRITAAGWTLHQGAAPQRRTNRRV